MRLSIDHRHAPPQPVTIEWDFDDCDAWHIRVDDGGSTAHRGHAPRPDLVLRSTFQDWVDVAAGRTDARVALLRRRLRPRGSVGLLVRFGRMFGG
jgi:putative sterol carrier protein